MARDRQAKADDGVVPAGGVADEENLDLVLLLRRQGPGKAGTVVGAFTPVGCIVQDQKRFHDGLGSISNGQSTSAPLGHTVRQVEGLIPLLSKQLDCVLGHQAKGAPAIRNDRDVLGQLGNALLQFVHRQ